eukprot:TRINITY_DN18167_c0_g1_i1.p2 TRINITY_DN18167_c0_g1~~TRINITY_DN18167_c0_g1_i1.p2  ORF type:complete len:105 (-),score=1.42 TRINITY_DN18167_c0_g1_i1:53-367(-)
MVSSAQLFSFVGMLITAAAGVFTNQLLPSPPASNKHTEIFGFSESLPASTLPAEPPPITTKSNAVCVIAIPVIFILSKCKKIMLKCTSKYWFTCLTDLIIPHKK